MNGSPQPLVVRFQEAERYDITRDAEVVMFLGTTNFGSFYAEVEKEGAKTLRAKRDLFRERTLQLMQAGSNPCEVDLSEAH